MKTIQFFTDTVYGRSLDYVIDPQDALCMAGLTGRKTITAQDRDNVQHLTGGLVQFKQTLKPTKQPI